MTTHRVVVTGVGLASPVGTTLAEVSQSLQTGRHGIVTVPEWSGVEELRTRLAGVVPGYRSPPADSLLKPNAASGPPRGGEGLAPLDLEGRWPRKKTRTMGRVGLLATYATEQALASAGLQDDPVLGSGATGLAYGSTSGSSEALVDYCVTLFTRLSMRGLQSTSFLKFMAHTCAANLSQFYGIRGRIIPTNSACTSGAQAIGYAYEAIKYGKQDVMIAGGADEMHFTTAVTFDLMFATSANFNHQPDRSPRPFDAKRDGLVVGEGAGTLILESYERARARGARIYAELLGFGTNCDGIHITAPSETGMCGAMALSLHDAGLKPGDIDYVNAHGTATDIGDVAETGATRTIFGRPVPISSPKSFTGHTMGACGAIEAAFCLVMLQDGFLMPTRNLDELDPRCADLDYVREVRRAAPTTIMSNNFAFGGVNTSLIFRRVD
ncbi:MAG: beta-ketoacyl-ACP synthase [Myxococcales bacterium]|nr:beta-ketoacyl-ACP synthase [Myxococcales bacterium]